MHSNSNRRRATLWTIALTTLAGLALQTACLGTARCDALRTELLHKRDGWTGCDPAGGDDQCVLVAGDGTDCTGVFRCSFAVNRVFRSDAEHAVIDNASDAPVCEAVCSNPRCGQDSAPRCDATTHRCVVDVSTNNTPIPVNDAAPPPDDTNNNPTPVDAGSDHDAHGVL